MGRGGGGGGGGEGGGGGGGKREEGEHAKTMDIVFIQNLVSEICFLKGSSIRQGGSLTR